MPKFTIELSHQVTKILEKMIVKDSRVFQRIARAIDDLEINPFLGKPLKGQLKGRYSYRVGRYRIIYKVEKNILTVYVIDIGHRRDIYQ